MKFLRKKNRNNMPKAEIILWDKLRSREFQNLKFRRQHSVGKYILDFYCPEIRLAIEIDGDTHFVKDGLKLKDLERSKYINSFGINILRFTNTDIYENLDGVLQKIFEVTSTTPPLSSPQKGGVNDDHPSPLLKKEGTKGPLSNKYLAYDSDTITNFSDLNIESMYEKGFVMTRVSNGNMNQTRSLRIDLNKFELTSENRRILRKTESMKFKAQKLPIDIENYDWHIHKIGKEFYRQKFNAVEFSANKIKELLTTHHNFNRLFIYEQNSEIVGYCICLVTDKIIHYCYPFYRLDIDTNNIGMGMMIKAILFAKENNKQYIYLGSVQRESDKYKLQFNGLEVFSKETSSWNSINTLR